MSRLVQQRRSLGQVGWRRSTVAALRMFGIIFVVLIAVGLWVDAEENALRDSSYSTGYLLFGSVLFLAAYNVRKKVPTLPLGSSRTWLRWHLTVGWIAIGVFIAHTKAQFPSGGLEWMLFILFVLTAGSGIYGLYLTKIVPRRLLAIGEEVIFEQIPLRRRAIADQARAITLESIESTEVLARFYKSRAARFLETSREWPYYLRPTGSWRRELEQNAKALDRYLSEAQRLQRDRLSHLIRAKDDLDYQYALQWRMKSWLFAHIGMTYSLIIVAAYHGLVAHAFRGVH